MPVGHRRHYFLDRFRHDGFCNVTAHMGLLSHFLLSGAHCMAGLRFPDRSAWHYRLGCVRHRHYRLSPAHCQNWNGILQNAAISGCQANKGSYLVRGLRGPPPIEQISKLRADVIFVQGCSNYNRTLKFAYSIFGRTSYIKQIGSCAIIVRHGQIGPAQSITDTAGLIVDWIPEKFLLGDSAHQHQSGTF